MALIFFKDLLIYISSLCVHMSLQRPEEGVSAPEARLQVFVCLPMWALGTVVRVLWRSNKHSPPLVPELIEVLFK